MAQVSALAPGVSAANSTDIAIPANSSYTVGLYTDAAGGWEAVAGNQGIKLYVDTPGSVDTLVAVLTRDDPVRSFTGKCTLRGVRPAQGGATLGLFYDDGT